MSVIKSEVKSEDVKDSREETIKKFIEELKQISHLKNFLTDEKYVLRFLLSTEFNIEAAFERYVGYHEHVADSPDFYPQRGPLDMKQIMESRVGTLLPDLDREGRPIYLVKSSNINFGNMTLLDFVAMDDCWLEYILLKNPEISKKGLCVVSDVKDVPYGMFRWMNITNMKRSVRKQNNIPLKDIVTHIVNKAWMIQVAVKIAWPLLSEENKKNIHFHFTNYSSLHEHIDPKFLPIEYGGSKEVDYDSIYKNLYEKHDEIVDSYTMARKVKSL